jgi:two-component system sensor histidine kinase FlrB
MTATLAHQIRTPLASALLYAKRLREQSMPDAPAVEQICDRLEEIARLVNDMLCYAGDAQRGEERFSVSQLFESIVEVSWDWPGDVELSIALARDDLVVSGNRDAIKGALLNLIDNAFQACGRNGRVELGAEVVAGKICLTVSDDGHGIPADIKDRLFEPFFTTRPKGTGLGLAVVHAVAAAHNGDVLVDSGPNGSTFALCLPNEGGVL